MAVGKQLGELLLARHAVADPHAGGETDRAQHGVDMVGAVARHLGKIEALQDAQGQQVLERLTGRRRHVHGAAAIVR